MRYYNAASILSEAIVEELQKYVDGAYLYVPQRSGKKKNWGENTDTLALLRKRNRKIYSEFLAGCSITRLSEKYHLVEKSIQRIIRQEKK